MNSGEYTNLERVEGEHWYYAGKREFVRGWLQRVKPPQPDHILLDCGAGTGRFAKEMEEHCRVLVLDDHDEALALLRSRFQASQVLALVGGRVPLEDATLDYVTALDVLEHTVDDRAVVEGFHRLLRPGGVAVVTVPASMALWSDWDVALHHHRRYTRSGLTALFPAAQWEVLHVNYTNVFAFPAVWLVRKSRNHRPGVSAARAEDKLPPRWMNALLRWLFVRPAFWPVPFPCGVSLLLVARRR